MNVTTQQTLILMGFGTICGIVLFSFIGVIIYAVVHDGAAAVTLLDLLKQTIQWGIIGISGVLGIHTWVNGGIIQPAPAAPLVPAPVVPDDGPVVG